VAGASASKEMAARVTIAIKATVYFVRYPFCPMLAPYLPQTADTLFFSE
jgi:hypothetical protein